MKCKATLPSSCVQQQKSKHATGKNLIKDGLHAFFKTGISILMLVFFSSQTMLAQCVSIGDHLQGGIVFYVDNTGHGGLIAAPADQSNGCGWGCSGTVLSYSNGTGYGDGLANSNAIVTQCTTPGIGAQLCRSLSLGGYTDWYLPSVDELNLLYQQKNVVGGFVGNGYFTSNQDGIFTIRYQNFNSGIQGILGKDNASSVRAIRKFSNVCNPAEALDFDGVNDYVNLGNSLVLKPAAALTVELWLYESDWTSLSPISTRTIVGNTQTGGYSLELDSANRLSAWVFRNGAYGIASIDYTNFSAGWHHLAMTYDGRYNRLYVDCNLAATNDAGGNFPVQYSASGNATIVGAEASDTNVPIANTNCLGKMDELRIWNYARSCPELCQRKNCELSSGETGLIAYYHFNQGIDAGNNTAITSLTDATANTLDGVLNNFSLTGTTSNWVAPGAVTTGVSCTGGILAPEISVLGNLSSLTEIFDGDLTPGSGDFTDYGNVPVNSRVGKSISA